MNKKWKIAFCGLGSIGSRHLRNLIEILASRGDKAEIDWIQHADREKPREFESVINSIYHYEEELPTDYDIVFITNSTYMHRETIEKMQWRTHALFIEKPLFAFADETLNRINPQCIYYVACPIRYKKVIQYIKKNINSDDILSAISICSSYLPEWRPDTDYRKCYSAIQKKGGGVSLDLIHELDYLCYLLGDINEIYNIRGKISPLEVDSDDISVYIAKIDKKVVQVHLDYFGRADIRKLIIFTKNDTIETDLLCNTIRFLKEQKAVDFQETRDDFQKQELICFLDIIEGKTSNINDIVRAKKTFYNTFGRLG